jgi:hypothetical protein
MISRVAIPNLPDADVADIDTGTDATELPGELKELDESAGLYPGSVLNEQARPCMKLFQLRGHVLDGVEIGSALGNHLALVMDHETRDAPAKAVGKIRDPFAALLGKQVDAPVEMYDREIFGDRSERPQGFQLFRCACVDFGP